MIGIGPQRLSSTGLYVGLQEHLPAALTALAIACFISTQYLGSPLVGLGLVAIAVAFLAAIVFAKWSTGPSPIRRAGQVFIGSATIAIFTSPFYFGNQVAAIFVWIWTLVMVVLFLIDHTERVFAWLIPAWLIHATILIVQGVRNLHEDISNILPYGSRTPGIMDSPNVAAGFMLMGLIYLLHRGPRWLAVPMTLALIFTGSRFAIGLLVLLLGGMLLTRVVPWRQALAISTVAIIVSIPFWGSFAEGYRLNWAGGQAEKVGGDLAARLQPHTIPTLIPQGPIGQSEDTHNVPMRLAIEQGLLTGIVWVAVTSYGLLRRPRLGVSWWMLLGFTGISMLEYYPFMPLVISPFWWTLVSIRVKSNERGGITWEPSTFGAGDYSRPLEGRGETFTPRRESHRGRRASDETTTRRTGVGGSRTLSKAVASVARGLQVLQR